MEDITFEDNKGNKLQGTLSIPKGADSVVIISHGFQSNKESRLYLRLENELNKIGIGTFRYDYYGHGSLYCKGNKYAILKDVTLTKTVDSLRAAIAYVRSQGKYRIGLVGSSFGGLVSLIVASEDTEIKALAMKSPVTEPISFWKGRLGDDKIHRWKQEGILHFDDCGERFDLEYGFWEDLLTYDTYAIAKDINCPVLIIHGDSDTVVPIEQNLDFAQIVDAEINIIRGADHDYTDPVHFQEMKSLIIEFIVENLGK